MLKHKAKLEILGWLVGLVLALNAAKCVSHYQHKHEPVRTSVP